MKVVHYQRKRRANANYSLEQVFESVRNELLPEVSIDVAFAPAHSDRLFPRLKILRDVSRVRADVVHVTGDINFAALGVPSRFAVATILDVGFLHRTSGVRRLVLKKLWLDWPVRHSCVVTTISQVVKEEIVALTGCDSGKVRVVPVAISKDFKPSSKRLDSTAVNVLVVGTAPNKNLPRIINALSGTPCTLTIVGVLSQELIQLLTVQGVPYRSLVNLPRSGIVAAYQEADILCFPSIYEGFGMPILEAQATGRPVITSNCSSMPEVAGDAARFVDPLCENSIREGLMHVLEDVSYRDALVSKGFQNVSRFDAQAIAQQYLNIYQEVFERR